MEPRSTAAEMQDLLEHQAWVKALAMRLVRDPHLAEDLAQETCVVALQRPSGSVQTMRAWLATVLRNLVRERARVDGSRRWREETTARDEATSSTLEMYAKVSAHQRVVETVNDLPELYREVLLLRYFEGLTPTTIAERVGVPVSTVKTRLARGLSQMRERLDRANGGDGESWLRALAPLTGVTAGGALKSALVTALVLRSAALLALIVGGSWWGYRLWERSTSEELRSPTTALEVAQAPEVAPASEPSNDGPVDGDREELPVAEASASIEAPVDAPIDYPLRGRVEGLTGQGIGGVVLSFQGRSYGNQPGNTWITVSESQGDFEFGSVRGAGRVSALGESFVTLFAGEVGANYSETELVVVVAPGGPLAGRVVDEEGLGVPGAEVAILPPSDLIGGRGEEALTSILDLRFVSTDAQGAFDLGVALEVPGCRLQIIAEGYATFEGERPVGSHESLLLTLEQPGNRTSDWVGRVEAPNGAGLVGARVSTGGRTTRSGENGEFRFDSQAAYLGKERPRRVHAWHPDFGPASAEWSAETVLRLPSSALSVRGRVVDETDQPVVGLTVYLAEPTLFSFTGENEGGLRRSGELREDLLSRELRYELLEDLGSENGGKGLAWTRTTTDEDGGFELSGLADQDYRLVLFQGGSLDRRVTDPIAAGREDVELTFAQDSSRVRVAGQLVDFAGRPVVGARVGSTCAAFPVGYEGDVLVTSTRKGPSYASDEQGHFDLGRIALDSVYLEIFGEEVVRQGLGLEDGALADLEASKLAELRIVVHRRLRVRVELAQVDEADRVSFFDGEGQRVSLVLESPGRERLLESIPLVGGASDLMIVPDTVKELALWHEGQELRRVPVEFQREGVTLLRP